MQFDKVKALGKGFAVAAGAGAAAGALEFSGTVDWSVLGISGPFVGAAVGAGIQWAVGFFKSERTGYGAGVPKPSDAIPGGSPLPTGASFEDAIS